MSRHQYAVILAGGIGSRFWPVSRVPYPKQFIDILGIGKTPIQLTYQRFEKFFQHDRIFIITNENYRDFVLEQIPQCKPEQLLYEPMRKNTGPCIAYASYKLFSMDQQASAVFAPSDHLILSDDQYAQTIAKALKIVQKKDLIVTLGIPPTRPDTAYGYIQILENKEEDGIFKVKTFVEKPPLDIAETFFKSGDFLWNAGIFIANIRTLINAYQHYLPEVNDCFKEGKKFYNTPQEKSFVTQAYSLCPNVSIDHGIMEKAKNVCVIPSNFGWSDLGTWASLYAVYNKDYLGNAVSGKNVMVYESSNCMVTVPHDKLVVLQGLDDYIVADTKDVLLICKKDMEQKIKDITADVKRTKGEKFL